MSRRIATLGPGGSHLLSHRLRGFDAAESSLPGLRAAIGSPFSFFEVDTRHTADGEILVYHDTTLESQTRRRGYVEEYRLGEQGPIPFRAGDGVAVATLEELLAVFATSRPEAFLMIDVKDFGLEERYCALLDRYGLAGRVILISWTPEVLKRFFALRCDIPLGLSYLSFLGTPWAGVLRRLPRPLWQRQSFGRACAALARVLPAPLWKELARTLFFYNDYDRPYAWLQDHRYRSGHFPIHLVDHLPGGELGELLAATGGFVGTHSMLANGRWVEEARRRGLGTFVFSVDGEQAWQRYQRRLQPDIVFTNDHRLAKGG
jgi:glycerophosphoryl diester phosphodiesterase